MKKRTYDVTVSHPTNFHKGTKRLSLYWQQHGLAYLTGEGFGCSRDYLNDDNETDDASNICEWMREHGCDVTKIVAV